MSYISWDVTPCGPLKVNRRFGGALIATCLVLVFAWLIFLDPEDGGDVFLRNVGWISADYAVLYPRR
jgi:hypothetical protein